MLDRMNMSAWAISQRSIMFFMMAVITFVGAYSFAKLGRAEDPDFAIKAMVVSAVWPGATVEDMEQQVADRIEARIQDLPGLDYIETYSRPGEMFLRVQLRDSIPGEDIPELWYQVRKKVGDIEHTLPRGVIGPFFNDEYSDVIFTVYALTSTEASHDDLVDYAEIARSRLERVRGVEKVELIGEQDRKVYVEISYARLASLGIPPAAVFDSLARQNSVVPSGALETDGPRIEMLVDGAFASVEDVAAVPIEANGRIVRLGDVARVYRDVVDPPFYEVRHEGVAGVALALTMETGENGLSLGAALDPAVEEIKAMIPTGITWSQVADQPKVIAYSFNEFLVKICIALLIVLIVSFLSLGWRTGIVVALAVPLTLALTFMVMEQMGTSLQRISLGALILSLGLLVDDAIIAVEMMVVKLEEGLDREAAGAYTWKSTAFPTLAGTLVTCAGFLPIGFAVSTAGDYAGGIFWVVTITLIASWFVARLFTPVLGVALLPSAEWYRAKHGGHDRYDTPPYVLLRRATEACMRRPGPVFAGLVGLFVLAGAAFTQVPQQFFPTSSRPEVLIEISTPEGASFEATRRAAQAVEARLAEDEDVEFYTTYVGAGAPRFFLALDPILPNPKRALIVAQTKDAKARDRVTERIYDQVREGAYPEARVRPTRLLFGPPVSFPVEFRIVGPDPAQLKTLAYELREIVQADAGVRDIQFLWEEYGRSVHFDIDQDRLRGLGVTPNDIGVTLQTFLTGAPVTQMREGNELIDVVVRAPENERTDISGIEDLTVVTRSGAAIPLAQAAKATIVHEPAISWRRNREPFTSVRADVFDGVQGPDVTARLMPLIDDAFADLPEGYRIEVGGSVEESAKANAALIPLFPIMALSMLTILVFQLKTASRALLVFSTAPLGFIGASWALFATGQPFGFVSMLGLMAIGGMIIRNAVILIDQIVQNVERGEDEWTAVVDATIMRARPVILTALAAILGFLPLTLSTFWGAMAISMIGGLIVATILTLSYLPVLYVVWFKVRRPGEAARSSSGSRRAARATPAPAE